MALAPQESPPPPSRPPPVPLAPLRQRTITPWQPRTAAVDLALIIAAAATRDLSAEILRIRRRAEPPPSNNESVPLVLMPLGPDRDWQRFLSQLQGPRAPEVRALWGRLRADMPWLPLPRAGMLPDDGFQLVWDEGRHHVDIELVGDSQAEWFYLDRETRETVGEDFSLGGTLPRALLERLAFSAPESR